MIIFIDREKKKVISIVNEKILLSRICCESSLLKLCALGFILGKIYKPYLWFSIIKLIPSSLDNSSLLKYKLFTLTSSQIDD